MSRADVHAEMKEMLGTTLGFVDEIPDAFIDSEWDLLKRVQLAENEIPNKYKELIGLGIAAATRCRYCTYFHTEAAKLNGATDAEVEEALHYAKVVAGWSLYINGLQLDYDEFTREVDGVVTHVKASSS